MTTLSSSSDQLLKAFESDHQAWQSQTPLLLHAVDLLCKAYHQQALLLTCGNGGSAADASHIVGELVKSFRIHRPLNPPDQQTLIDAYGEEGRQLADKLVYGLRAVSLSSESILLTAMGNDVGFDMGFAQQVQALGLSGDILLALSTSGRSGNVLAALRVAKTKGMHTIGMTGDAPCPMDDLCDVIFHAPANTTHRIQEYHLAMYHAICLLVENQLFA